jgi:Transposase DDE domain group 1
MDQEGKGRIKWTRLSCCSFAANAVRLQLHALAYNLGNFLGTLATPEPIKDCSLTILKEKLIKIGAKVVSHGRYVTFQMAKVAITRILVARHPAADCGSAAAACRLNSVLSSICDAFHEKPRETCVLMMENSACFGLPPRAGLKPICKPPAGSQRLFSLSKSCYGRSLSCHKAVI